MCDDAAKHEALMCVADEMKQLVPGIVAAMQREDSSGVRMLMADAMSVAEAHGLSRRQADATMFWLMTHYSVLLVRLLANNESRDPDIVASEIALRAVT